MVPMRNVVVVFFEGDSANLAEEIVRFSLKDFLK
jgi:hypothetical protein